VQAGTTGLPDGVKAGQAGAAVEVGIDPADEIVRRGVDGDQVFGGVDVELVTQFGQLWEAQFERTRLEMSRQGRRG